MRLKRADPATPKGWCFGPWNSDLDVSVGYANEGIDDPHVHDRIAEIYVIARGTSQLRIEKETIDLAAGDTVVVEPGEAHTFLSNSEDYFHFVIHSPGLAGDEAKSERRSVPRSRLGL